MRTIHASLLLVGLATACSPSPGGGGSAAITLDTLGAETTSTYCHALFTCSLAGDDDGFRALFADEAACRAGYVRLIGSSFNDLVGLARAGTVRFDAAAARRCLDALASSCNLQSSDPSCNVTFTGTLAAGAQCFRSEQCGGDTWCDHGDFTMPTCPGTCRARVALGAACNTASQCTRAGVQGTASCELDSATGAGRCVDRRNTYSATAGQSCNAHTASGNVIAVANCQPGLLCTYTTPGGSVPDTGTCRSPTPAGAPCQTTSSSCAGVASCVATTAGGTAGTCQGITVQNTAGAPCDPMRICNPVQRLACVSGTCQTSGTGAVGTPCSSDLGLLICSPGLSCQSAGTSGTSTCQPTVANGMPCTTSDQCSSGSCGGTPSVCQAHVCR